MTAAVVPLAVRVAQAQRAAANGQVRMAEIYTARALQLVAIEKTETRKAMGIAKRRLRSHRMNSGISGFISGFSEIIAETFQPISDALRILGDGIASVNNLTQQDFALVDADQRLLDAMYAVQAGESLTAEQRKFL